MKKIIAAFDGLKYSESTRDYAIYLAKQTNTHLVGVFMDDRIYNSYKVYELMVKNEKPGNNMKKLEAKDKATRDAAAQNFEKACQKEGLEYTIHHDHNIAINELKHE
ncbi:MAG: universal stress protein, partial [Bacteroidota bacterium]